MSLEVSSLQTQEFIKAAMACLDMYRAWPLENVQPQLVTNEEAERFGLRCSSFGGGTQVGFLQNTGTFATSPYNYPLVDFEFYESALRFDNREMTDSTYHFDKKEVRFAFFKKALIQHVENQNTFPAETYSFADVKEELIPDFFEIVDDSLVISEQLDPDLRALFKMVNTAHQNFAKGRVCARAV